MTPSPRVRALPATRLLLVEFERRHRRRTSTRARSRWRRRSASAAWPACATSCRRIARVGVYFDPLRADLPRRSSGVVRRERRHGDVAERVAPSAAARGDPGLLRRRRSGPISTTVAAFAGCSPSRGHRACTPAAIYRVFMLGLRAGLRVHGRGRRALADAAPRARRACACRRARSASPARRPASIPAETPGGWQLIGRTPSRLFDLDARTGRSCSSRATRVRFVPVPRAIGPRRRRRTVSARR